MPTPPMVSVARRAETLRLYVLSFVIVGSFGIAAPATHSLLLAGGSLQALPLAWMVVMVCAASTTYGLRWAMVRTSVRTCFSIAAAVAAAVLAALLFAGHLGQQPWAFCLFVWRDVYIALLLELMWTQVGHSTLARHAGVHYGWLGAAGTAGAASGGLLNVALAQRLGTTGMLWILVPVLAAVAAIVRCGRQPDLPEPPAAAAPPLPPQPRPSHGRAVPRWDVGQWTHGLKPIAAMVLLAHTASTFVDYELAKTVRQALPDVDLRTAQVSRVHTCTQALSLLLQGATGLLLNRFGPRFGLMAAPAVTLIALVAYARLGGVAAILATKCCSKSFDTSLFRSAKEILYLPLSPRARTEGKAWIDIWGSRLAKALTSCLLLAAPAAQSGRWVAYAAMAACCGWLWVAGMHRPQHPTRSATKPA